MRRIEQEQHSEGAGLDRQLIIICKCWFVADLIGISIWILAVFH